MANLTIDTLAALDRSVCGATVTITTCDGEGNPYVAYIDGQVYLPRGTQVRTGGVSSATPGEVVVDLTARATMDGDGAYYSVVIDGLTWIIDKAITAETLLEASVLDPTPLTPAIVTGLEGDINLKLNAAEKAAASGVPSLNASSTVVQDVAATELGLQVRGATVRAQIIQTATQTPVGTQVVAIGTSHEIGVTPAIGTTASPAANSWANWMCWLSGGRWTMKRNGGVFGSTTAEMLANYQTRAGQYQGDVLLIGGPTNDATSAAESIANIEAIVALGRAQGAVPVVRTEIPRTTGNADRLSECNRLTRDLALRQGIHCIDLARSFLVNPANGSIDTAYTLDPGVDDVHLSVSASILVAQRLGLPVVDLLTPRAGGGLTLLPDWDDDPSNMLASACFSAGITGSDPTGWDFTRAFGWSGLVTVSLEDPAPGDGIVGKWFRLDFTNWNGQCEMLQSIVDTLWNSGDRLLVDFVFEADCTGDLSIDIGVKSQGTYFGGATAWPAETYPRSIVHTMPAMGSGATLSGAVHVTGSGSNSGYLRIAQFGAYNFTTLGLSDLWP